MFNLCKNINDGTREVLLNELKSDKIFVISPFSDMVSIVSRFIYFKKLKYLNIIINSNFYDLLDYLYTCNNNLKNECNLLNKKISRIEEQAKKYKKIVNINNEINMQLEQYKIEVDVLNQKYIDVVNSSSWRITSIYRKIGTFLKKIRKR